MRRNGRLMPAILGLVAAGCATYGTMRVAELHDQAAPDFELTDLNGRVVRLSELRGKPVLLGFWSVG